VTCLSIPIWAYSIPVPSEHSCAKALTLLLCRCSLIRTSALLIQNLD